jgi:hypothetical protein
MSADWVWDALSAAGAAGVFATVGWHVILWKRIGAPLKVSALVSGLGNDMRVSGRLVNQGRTAATIEDVTVAWIPTGSSPGAVSPAMISIPLPDGHLTGLTLGNELEALTGKEYTIERIADVDQALSLALYDRQFAQVTFRTATGAKANARIKYPKPQ